MTIAMETLVDAKALATRFDGGFAAAGTVADRIHAGNNLCGWIEGEMEQFTPSLDHLGFDWYDNSMELHFEDHVVDLEPSPEHLQRIWDYGFSQCWFNFQGGRHKGGTERHYTRPKRLSPPKVKGELLKPKDKK